MAAIHHSLGSRAEVDVELKGMTALVTGASQRVGRSIALGLADAGVDVFVHYNRSAAPAEETANDVRGRGVKAAVGSADLGDEKARSGLLEQVAKELAPPQILINAASGFPQDTLSDVQIEGFRKAMAVTLEAPVFLTQEFARRLPHDLDGAVVNVTDVRTLTPYANHFSYIVAKGALDTFTRASAVALAPRIRVNAVALGVILPPPGEGDEYADRLASSIPAARPGGTRPVVDAVLHLIANDFITGEIIRVDGGGHLV